MCQTTWLQVSQIEGKGSSVGNSFNNLLIQDLEDSHTRKEPEDKTTRDLEVEDQKFSPIMFEQPTGMVRGIPRPARGP